MSNRTEQDYDSATPALQQQMNLARRACWRTKSSRSDYPPKSIELVNPMIANQIDAIASPPRDETKTRTEPQTAFAARKTTCTFSDWRGILGKRMLLICGFILILGIAHGRPNTSAVGVASAKDGKDIADAVTQLNVSMPTIRNPQSNSMAIKPGITSTSGVQLKLFR